MMDKRLDNLPEPAWAEEDQGQSLPLMDYLQLLWFRRNLIIAITIFVGVIGYVQINELKNRYSATSTLMIGLPQNQVLNIEAVLDKANTYGDVEGEIAVLTSRVLAEKVIKRLNLTNHPEFNPSLRKPEKSLFDFTKYLNPKRWVPASWKKTIKEAMGRETERAPPPAPATPLSTEEKEQKREHRLVSTAINIYLGKLSVKRRGSGQVININFTSLDPKTAARLANHVPEAYILDQMESKFEATEKANIWLTEQLVELEAKVMESERAVEIYRDNHGLAETSGSSMLDKQLSELNSQLIIARSEKAGVDARLAQLRRLVEGGGQGVETASEVLSSTLVQQLRGQEAQALSRVSQLAVEYGPKHPRMLQVTAELGEIRERIRIEIERIIIGLEQEAEFAYAAIASRKPVPPKVWRPLRRGCFPGQKCPVGHPTRTGPKCYRNTF